MILVHHQKSGMKIFLGAVDRNGEVDSSGNSPRLETPQELATRRLEPGPQKSVPRSEDQPQVTVKKQKKA